jgi:hypothetical protein
MAAYAGLSRRIQIGKVGPYHGVMPMRARSNCDSAINLPEILGARTKKPTGRLPPSASMFCITGVKRLNPSGLSFAQEWISERLDPKVLVQAPDCQVH